MKTRKKSPLTADNLKTLLWQTLQNVRDKKVDTATANSIASSAREIIRVIRCELEVARMTGTQPASAFGGKLIGRVK